MKLLITLALILCCWINAAYALDWKANITRKESNLYKINFIGGFNNEWFVKTKYCYEYAYSQDVFARWEMGGWNNYIQFNEWTKCDIESIQNVITYK